MPRSNLLRQRLLTLFLIAMLLLFSPLTPLVERIGHWRGIPMLLIHLYGTWAAIILLAAWITTRRQD